MINVIIEVSEDTRVVQLAGLLAAIRGAGFDSRMARLPKPVVDAVAGLAAGNLAAYKLAVSEARQRAQELRREAEYRAAEEQGLGALPRARFGDWWEAL